MKPLKTLVFAMMLAGQVMAADDKVMLNFVNSDVESTVKAVGLITGKNFVLDPRVKGTVNIVSSSPVHKREVYTILLSALRLQGFAVVETPGAVKIVPEADAKQNFGTTANQKLNVSGDRIVTQVYPLMHESAAQMVPILRPLITPNNSIAAYPGSNVLVITDYADNIKRLNQIIANIDQPSTNDLITLPLKYASALEVAQMIGKLMPEVSVPGVASATPAGAQMEGVRRTSLIPDTRANTLIVRGDNPTHLAQIKQMVDSLDRAGSTGGNIHVVYLKNANATKLAATLKAILTGTDVPQQTTSTSSSTSGTSTTGTASVQSSTGGGGQISPGVAVQGDPTTNSLIVTAPDNVYNNIRAVIDRLDVRRAQVYVEALIAEVNVSKVGEFGVQWLAGGIRGDVAAGGVSNLGKETSSITSMAAAIKTKAVTSLPAGMIMGIANSNKTLGAVATMLESNGDGNVLSTPNIITLDNEEASIIVGQTIPVITGTQSSTGSNPNPFTSVERKDIGITLKVTPQVSEGGSITMTVEQEVSSIDTEVSAQITGTNTGVTTKKRQIKSKVLVNDGQTIVLGGLIENKLTKNESKVPFLGDIPLLGRLFNYEKRENKRSNLMVFLRPVILRDDQSTSALSNDRYEMLRKDQAEFVTENRAFLPDLPQVVAPVLDARPGKGLLAPEPATPEPAETAPATAP
ncbi:type II secretion system secretin GspD [Chitinimonas sp. BJB300]|uniref:type II secretion system secretin GspD n=1 Tax=Chitinimonas sp. BJB300 TaxID=1559339 RepID=UPI0018ED712B|nr:type II secretion system secretin GspD [Chitinimonas sp. BJB300]